MKTRIPVLLFILSLSCISTSFAQVYPPDVQLVFDQMPNIPKPAYLSPITDPTFGSIVTRISDQAVFNAHTSGMSPYHAYAKVQTWNSDGTKILLAGWPGALLDGETYEVIGDVWPPGGHYTWANTNPNIVIGSNNPNYDGNCIAQTDVNTNVTSLVHCFSEYEFVSHGAGEGNISNDDRYMALQCRKPNGAMEIACYDFVTNTKVSSMSAPVWPNNVTMTQSGNYVIVQWDVHGTGPAQGTWAYNRSDMSPVRNLAPQGGSHFDYGYDTQGNEVMAGPASGTRQIIMVRIDNGAVTNLLADNQMSWYIHISCRNLDRPGWAYLTEFADPNTQTFKPNYQKIFAVKLDPNANDNAVTETFAHVHHSPHVNYQRSPFGTPNRDGSKVMFRSDWMGNSSSEINAYVAHMPQTTQPPTCNNNITIDGNFADWSGVPSLTTNGSGGLTNLKTAEDDNVLFLLAEGSFGPNFQFFLDSDSGGPGARYLNSLWMSSSMNYLIENGNIYKYTGTGQNWSWNNVGTSTFIKSAGGIELSINKNLLTPLGSNIGVGSVSVSSAFTPIGKIPDSSTSVNYQVGSQTGTNCGNITCNVKVKLEGCLDNTGTMTTALQQSGILPTVNPYTVAPWNYQGTEGTGWQQSDYPSGTVDWALLSFRTGLQPDTEVAKVAAVLLDDGSTTPVQINVDPAITELYVVVEHRNHLPAITPSAIPVSNGELFYDFSLQDSYVTASGFGQKQVSGNWCLYAGNADQSGTVGNEVTGADAILWQADNGNFNTYLPSDFNLDSDINAADRIIWFLNNGISSSVLK